MPATAFATGFAIGFAAGWLIVRSATLRWDRLRSDLMLARLFRQPHRRPTWREWLFLAPAPDTLLIHNSAQERTP